MKKKEIILIIAIIIIQSVIYIIAGANKQYIHMDEAYSLGLASYDKVEIQENEDFYNIWHNKEYYEDYITVNDDEIGEYSQVYENQKNDVHPPIYYLLLRFAMGFNKNEFSMWPGIILNILIYGFVTLFMYLILKQILTNETRVEEKSAILALLSSITMASLTSVIYIRMYALSTLNVLITTFLHIKLLKEEKINWKLLIGISVSALVGSLTHYYYLFYLAMLYIIFVIKYIKEKRYKEFGLYTGAIGIAAILSLIMFPYSIQHMFFGYRGQGVISKLLDIPNFLSSIGQYLFKINMFAANNMLIAIILLTISLYIVSKIRKVKNEEKNEILKIIIFPTIFYFLLVAVASPWIELRYIMPICALVLIIAVLMLYKIAKIMFSKKICNLIILGTMLSILIAPFVFKIEPEVMYSDKKEIVKSLENDLNIPTLYLFNSGNNRFLDDILLFTKLDESYVAKDIECTQENINQIFKDKDISRGIVIFINEGQENDDLLNIVKQAINLENSEYIKRLNACDVYYVY